ncbi:MAG TPA: SagB/ThcOx family dehydrogenase [Bryobacteraceae bacterium]|nr:SagB/ThcOx family dehydrogenase [Bryobacteraceae bacterium]
MMKLSDKIALRDLSFLEFAAREGDYGVTLVTPPGGQRFAVKSLALLEILATATAPTLRSELACRLSSELDLPDGAAERLLDSLLDRGVLEPVDENADTSAIALWQQYNWEAAGLYHFTARGTRFADIDRADQCPMELRERVVANYRRKDPFPYREIAAGSSSDEIVALPNALRDVNWPLGPTLLKRRTLRTWTCRTLPLQELANLLWYGLRPIGENRAVVDADPAFTQLTPLMTHFAHLGVWVLPIRTEGAQNDTIYRYDPVGHRLVRRNSFEGGLSLESLCVGQVPLRDASVVVILSGIFTEFMWRYRHNRAYSVVLLEVGQMMQNLILTATASGLRPFITPALRDSRVDQLLMIDGYDEGALYLSAFG